MKNRKRKFKDPGYSRGSTPKKHTFQKGKQEKHEGIYQKKTAEIFSETDT